MRFARKIIIISSIILVLIIGLGVALAFFLTRSPGMEEEMRSVEVDAGVESSLNAKINTLEEEIRAAVVAGEVREVRLVLSEAEVSLMLTDMMGEAMAESSEAFSDEMIKDTVVNLAPDGIRAIVEMEIYGISVNAAAEVQARVEEGWLVMELKRIEVGQLPLTGFVSDRIADRFNESHSRMDLDDLHTDLEPGLPVGLEDLFLGDGQMIIIGTAG